MTPVDPIGTDGIELFSRLGFLRMPGFVPPDLLARLRQLFDAIMVPGAEGVVTMAGPSHPVVTNVDLLCHRGNLAALELLGFAPMQALARQICGEDAFLIQEFAVIKYRGDDNPVAWHKDMVHRRTGTALTVGIYLDDAEAGDGALIVVPGSHSDPRDICALSREPSIDVPMAAGDLLIHDMMLAHSSGTMLRNSLRRVIYFEFLSAAHVAREAIYPSALVARRARLGALANRLVRGEDGDALRPELAEIYAEPIRARPSSYCVNGAPVFDSF